MLQYLGLLTKFLELYLLLQLLLDVEYLLLDKTLNVLLLLLLYSMNKDLPSILRKLELFQ